MYVVDRIVPKLTKTSFLKLRKTYVTDAEIARHFGVSRERIRQIRSRLGIESTRDIKRRKRLEILTLHENGFRSEIAKTLKISPDVVKYAIVEIISNIYTSFELNYLPVITIKIDPDQNATYHANRLEVGKAVDTFKKRMVEIFGKTVFENTSVREIESSKQEE